MAATQLTLTPLDYYALYLGNVYSWSIPVPPQEYLYRRAKESTEDYQDRASRTVYDPWVRKVVDIQASYVMAGAKSECPPNSFDIFALSRDIATHAYIGGYCYILTLPSGPKVYPCLIDGWAPFGSAQYPKVEGADRVWRWDGADARGFEIRFPAQAYENGTGRGTLTETRDGTAIATYPITADQWVKVCWNSTETSLVKDVARLAVQIYNLQSVYDYAAERLGSFYLFGPSLPGDIVPAPGAYLAMSADLATPGVIAWADTSAVKALQEIIASKVTKLAQGVGLMDEFAEEVKLESGVAQATRMTKNAMVTAAMADAVNKASNDAAATWGRLNNRADIPTISIPREVKPDARAENLDILIKGAEFIADPEALYNARRLAAQSLLEGIPSDDLAKVFASIDKTGRTMPAFDPYSSFGASGIPRTADPGAEMEPEEPEEEEEDDDEEEEDGM